MGNMGSKYFTIQRDGEEQSDYTWNCVYLCPKLQLYITTIYGIHTIDNRKTLLNELEVIHSGTDGA